MRFTYEGTEYDLVDPDTWTTLEASRLQQVSGSRPHELVQDFHQLGALGVHALVWVSLKRAGVDKAWDELGLPYFATVSSMNGDAVQEPPDPSTASTPRPTKGRARGATRAASKKN